MSKPSVPVTKRIGWISVGSIAVVGVLAIAAIVFALPFEHGQANHAATAPSASQSAKARIRANYAALPLAFEPNQGQTDPEVRYTARGKGYRLYLTSSEAIMKLRRGNLDSPVLKATKFRRLRAASNKHLQQKPAASHNAVAVVRMRMAGANTGAQLAASDLQHGKVNYLTGKNPANWHSNVPLYGRVEYKEIYPGVDLAFHGAGSQMEFDYIVNPGANAGQIALDIDGAEKIRTTAQGDLVLATSAGDLQLNRPVAYQDEGSKRHVIDARFEVAGNQVRFALGSYDHSRELVIDPTVSYNYSTYFGGDFADYGISIAVDGSGDAFVAGGTDSDSLPLNSSGTVQDSFDVFVTEISPAGACDFTTIFGGSGDEFPGGIAVDSAGIYVAGTTQSSDFPVTTGAPQTTFQGGPSSGDNDAFAVKLSLDGSGIDWGTYIAGNNSDTGEGIAVDSSHNVYVVGDTFSTNLPVKNYMTGGSALNLSKGTGSDDGYIAVVNAGGTAYNLVSYIGGSDSDAATGVALDGSGNAYVSGVTDSGDFPVTSGVVQSTLKASGVDNIFVASIKAATFEAANLQSSPTVVAKAASPRRFSTLALWLPMPGFALVCVGLASASSRRRRMLGLLLLVVALGTLLAMPACGGSGSSGGGGGGGGGGYTPAAYKYATYYGGTGGDSAYAITADSAGNVFVVGSTYSSDFPVSSTTYQSSLAGTQNAFLVELNSSGSAATYSTYLGGNGSDFALGVAVDANDVAYITGQTSSTNFPRASATQSAFGGSTDAFVSVLNPGSNTLTFSTYLGGSGDEDTLAGAIALDSSLNIYVTGDTDSGNGTTTPFPTSNALDGTFNGNGSCTSSGSTVPCPDAFITSYPAP